ncbi:anterior gradient protein 2 homolog isoform X1 [Hippocampus comes]|nr:PREDICTED: anterior gradient protein 2 homolog isoform X1 [Hippocampus comes]
MFVCFQLKWPLPCCPCRFCLGLKSSFSNVYLAKMIKISPSLLLVLVAAAALTLGKYMPKTGKRIPQTLSRGWGDQLIWAQTYEQALYWARSRNKPLMVLFHLEDCPHSQALKKVFAEDDELQKVLDEDFVLLNLMYETTDKHLSPDGQYVPRILFVDPSMTVRADVTGRYANRMYAYEPNDVKLLKNNMKKAKKLLKSEL